MLPKFIKKINLEDLLILIGLLIRSFLTFSHNYWFDEKVSLNISQFPFLKLLHMAALDNHPPLYYLYLKLFSPLLLDAYLLRFTSVLLGVFSLWVAFKFFSLITNRSTSLIALLIMSLSPLQIYYSTELRMYPLFVFLGLIFYWSITRYLTYPKITNAFYLLISASLLMYTHYFGIILVLTSVVYVFLYYRKHFVKTLLLSFISGLLFLPWFIYTINFTKPGCWCFAPTIGIPAIFASFTVGLMGHFDIFDALTTNRIPLIFKTLYFLNIIYFFILYLLSVFKKINPKISQLQVFIWFPIILTSLISLKINIFSIRSFIVFSPIYYLIVAQILAKIKHKMNLYILISIFALCSVFILNAIYAWDL